RVLRQFDAKAARGEFWGCDIDETSIAWASDHLSPPFRFFRNDLAPPLELPGGSLDLVWAMSVFTHISDLWADWLLELHRLLAPGGVLIASHLGEGMWEPLVGDPYMEDDVGMAVLHHADGPDAWVFHSEWWLREHWGRAFEPLALRRPPRGPDGKPQITHSYIALRRCEVAIGRDELERPNPDEPRELAGLETALRLARMDIAQLAAGREGSPQSRLERAARRLTARPRR
ncbi:MAG TPA: class I SAM-dependent methyltransferase, partial [Thermoleophilaceae bacterium]|nr:class I SAM-dependent methyltransferase [Thermoleophilaceae bacterium]